MYVTCPLSVLESYFLPDPLLISSYFACFLNPLLHVSFCSFPPQWWLISFVLPSVELSLLWRSHFSLLVHLWPLSTHTSSSSVAVRSFPVLPDLNCPQIGSSTVFSLVILRIFFVIFTCSVSKYSSVMSLSCSVSSHFISVFYRSRTASFALLL